jgi:hypothetical protein
MNEPPVFDPLQPLSQIMPPSVWEARLKDIERRLDEMEQILLTMHRILSSQHFETMMRMAESGSDAHKN